MAVAILSFRCYELKKNHLSNLFCLPITIWGEQDAQKAGRVFAVRFYVVQPQLLAKDFSCRRSAVPEIALYPFNVVGGKTIVNCYCHIKPCTVNVNERLATNRLLSISYMYFS